MRLLSALAVLLAGCATLPASPAQVPHRVVLPEARTEGRTGLRLTRGPLTLLRVSYLPARGTGKALLWRSTDPSCPAQGAAAFAAVLPAPSWDGAEVLGLGEFLCASHSHNQTGAQLTWWTEGGAPGVASTEAALLLAGVPAHPTYRGTTSL